MKILNEFEENLKKTPEYLNEKSGKWDRVYVEGNWDNSEQILIDNSVNRGVAGYKVLTPFRINETNKIILIDRGWIKQNKYRNELPNIEITAINETVSGIPVSIQTSMISGSDGHGLTDVKFVSYSELFEYELRLDDGVSNGRKELG